MWQALKRPGRLDREIYVGLPDDAARREIFEILFRRTPVATDVDIGQLVHSTQRYSGAEVSYLLESGRFFISSPSWSWLPDMRLGSCECSEYSSAYFSANKCESLIFLENGSVYKQLTDCDGC